MGKTILLVDESRTVQQAAQWVLEGSQDALVVAASGDEALVLAARHRPHVAIIAYHLPDQRGEELTRAFRADPALQEVRVVQLYGTHHAFNAGDARAAGAVGLLQKPFTSEELLDAIAHAHETEQIPAAAATQPVRQSDPVDESRLREAAAALDLEPAARPAPPTPAREETPTVTVPATEAPASAQSGGGFRRAFSTMAMRSPIRKPAEASETTPEPTLGATAEVPAVGAAAPTTEPAGVPAPGAPAQARNEELTGPQGLPVVEPEAVAPQTVVVEPTPTPANAAAAAPDLDDAALDARISAALETMIGERLDEELQTAIAPIVRRELPPLVKSLLKEMLSQLLREQLSRKVEEYSTRRIDAFVAEELPSIAERAIQKFVQGGAL